MLVALFCFSLCAGLLAGTLNNFFAKKKLVTVGDGYFFTLLRSIACLIALFLVALVSGSLSVPSRFTVLCGAAYGFLTFLSMVTNTLALSAGSYAATSLLCSLQMVIPAFSGFFFWHEQIHYGQYIGIVLLILGQFLCLWQGKQKVSLKWLIYCLISVISVGLLGIVQKIHQSSEYKDELSGFMLVAFVCSILFLSLSLLFIQRRPKMAVTCKPDRSLWFLAAVVGVCVAANNQINTALAGLINSIIFFPTFNGLNLLLTLLISIFLFRERFKVRQIIGFVFGLGGIVLLGNVLKLLTTG